MTSRETTLLIYSFSKYLNPDLVFYQGGNDCRIKNAGNNPDEKQRFRIRRIIDDK